jgi:selenide,water dikinase
LAEALKTLPISSNPNLLVGFNKADDAGVYRLSDDLALVQTVDFFPPIVDDPYYFGRIAAANALSDIYAMGGRPITALNIVGFPAGKMPESVLTDILRGGGEVIEEAGAVVLGGHSIKDDELKYGVATTGLIDPRRVITNAGAQVGDRLYLTKPLGTGLITTGIKRQAVGADLEKIVTEVMAQLNREAAEAMIAAEAHAATDITGYGLMGHSYEMASASGVSIRLFSKNLPLLPEALRLAEAQMIPAGAVANREFMNGRCEFDDTVDGNVQAVMFDPQTSGGLFVCLGADKAELFESLLKDKNIPVHHIGTVEKPGRVQIFVE